MLQPPTGTLLLWIGEWAPLSTKARGHSEVICQAVAFLTLATLQLVHRNATAVDGRVGAFVGQSDGYFRTSSVKQ